MRVKTFAIRSLALAAMALATVSTAHADQTRLIGSWSCRGENGGTLFESEFDYLADGRYISRQRISAGPNDFIEGGGGGSWRLEGNTLIDTKTAGRLDRFVRAGAEVSPSDPQFQQLQAGSQENLGATTQAELRFLSADRLSVGYYLCERRR